MNRLYSPRPVIILILSYCLFYCPVQAEIQGDFCQNAIPLTESTSYNGNSTGATGTSTSSCSLKDTKDVWHRFIPSQSGNYTISLCGSSFDTTLSVYDACGGMELACNDDLCSVQSEVVVSLTAGYTYLVRVAGYNGATGQYTLLADKRPDAPANDEFAGAIEVFETIPFNGTTLGATGDTYSSCAQGYDFYDVWHLFTPPAATEYIISLCNSGFDTTLAVFDDTGLEIGCNDDACDSQSKLNITLTGGRTYAIRVAGFDGAAGDYILNITRYSQQPVNDLCNNAIPLSLDLPYYGTTLGATGQKSSSCAGNDKLDVWHTFRPARSGYHTISLCGSSFDTTLAVYTSCTGSELACNDNMCDVKSEVVVYLTAGQTYYIRIAGKGGNTGDYVVVVTERFTQPANDDCTKAIEVFEDIPFQGSTLGALGSIGSSCGFYFDFYDVWHLFTPSKTGDYLISLCGSDFDTTLSVYSGCQGSELACNDDSCGSQSELVLGLTAGQTYWIRIAGYDGDMGNYDLLITESLPPPANDNCINAIDVELNVPCHGTTRSATGASVSSCGEEDTLDVWFRFTPPISGNYEISLCGSQFDTTLSVYDGCNGMELACNDDYCKEQSGLDIYLEADDAILIRVAGYRGAIGDYTLVVSSDCMPLTEPANPYPADLSFDTEREPVLSWNNGAAILENTSQPKFVLKGIYGTDDRIDEYQVANMTLKAIGDSTAAIIPLGDLTFNADGSFSMPSTTLAQTYLDTYARTLCSDVPFINQPAPAVCTAFLVAPDIVATTGHCIDDSSVCIDMAFVFGFTMINATTPVLTVHESDVYFCSGIIARVQTADSDWALIRLDREILTHAPLITRRAGKVPDRQALAVIGHTLGLPRKYANNAWVQDNLASGSFQANLDTFMGNSGSAVINMATYEVEGILYAGNPDFVQDGSCDRMSQCPDTGCPEWEQATRTTEFSSLIPVFDVYLGTSPDTMELISADNPRPWFQTNMLTCGTTWFWQVITKTSCTQTPGPVWVFSTKLAGDYDHDCDVDMLDYAVLAEAWMLQNCDASNFYCQGADIDKMGSVNLADLLIFANHWMERINP